MSAIWNWQDLMTEWNRMILSSQIRQHIPPDLIEKGWFGFPGATEEQLEQLEHRLGIALPPSYRSFLSFSNGWQGRLTHSIYNLLSTNEVDWFSRRHPDWLAAWTRDTSRDELITDEIYFRDPLDPDTMRFSYLRECLEISGEGDLAMLLLNPKVINQDGEWEAWFFADWLLGAERCPSFWELMQREFRRFPEIDKV